MISIPEIKCPHSVRVALRGVACISKRLMPCRAKLEGDVKPCAVAEPHYIWHSIAGCFLLLHKDAEFVKNLALNP